MLAVFVALLALVVFRPASAQQVTPQQSEQLAAISPHLESQLAASGEPVSFLVILDDPIEPQTVLTDAATYAASVEPADTMSARDRAEQARAQRAAAIYRTLTARAERSQAPLRAWLDANQLPYRAFYIVNMIEVQGDADVAQALRGMPGVDRLAANPAVSGQHALSGGQSIAALPSAAWLKPLPVSGPQSAEAWPYGLYGLPFTRAPAVWDLGFTGQGIVVASQDTGVQWDHPAIVDRYRGWDAASAQAAHAYNWFDAWSTPDPLDRCGPNHQVPCDDNGHGTHTVGTMLGDASNDPTNSYTVLGMAPDAEWIGCRNMRNDFGTPASYAACFQFMLAPYPQGGDPFTDGRPELAPHIINNSWSCPPSEGCDSNSLRQIVQTMREAGQLVVASAGNYGPACRSVQYPIGMYDAVFTVGAHDSTGTIAYFSSRGPVTSDGSNLPKPDISAPGVDVLSATTPGTYGYASGTSMSSPHVAGAAALLWSAAPNLIGNVDLTEQALIKSATPVADNQCLAPGEEPTSPNLTYGYGRLDILAAVMMARTPWELVVKVSDGEGVPQAGARVLVLDELTRYQVAQQTNANGVARIKPVLAGTYTVRVGQGSSVAEAPGIELKPAGNINAGDRSHTVEVTYLLPTGLDDGDFPPRTIYLPQIWN